MNSSATLRRLLIVVLLAVVAVLGWRYTGAGPKDLFGDADAMLRKRVDTYAALRKAEDWPTLYGMADPAHRKDVNLVKFLAYYGTGVLHLEDLRVNEVRIDQATRTAQVDVTIDASLVVDKLPPQYRNLREQHEEHLRQTRDTTLNWVWADNDWYFAMEPEVVTGRTADGNPAALIQSGTPAPSGAQLGR